MFQTFQQAALVLQNRFRHHFIRPFWLRFFQPQSMGWTFPELPNHMSPDPVLIGLGGADIVWDKNQDGLDGDDSHVWFAVPKKKVSRQKKRMKTTYQKRIPLRQNIITDPRTGELTLRHRLPKNWRDYLPVTESK